MNIDSMIQGNPQALVTSYNGVLVADSLEVADRFGKRHTHVLRSIDDLINQLESQSTELVTDYVKSRVFNRNDDTKELSPIAYKKIAAILGTLSGVANYDDLTVNGGTTDITIEPYEIPTVKKVNLT